jgi:hypothetical protein
MRSKIQKFFYIFIFFMLFGNSAYALTNFSKSTIVVLDERNNPIDGAYTGITFETNTGYGTKVSTGEGLTNLEGKFTATGSCNGHISYGAKKEGYYDSYYVFDFKGKNSFGWEPWNPELKVILRKIEKPIPMYARNTMQSKLEIPAVNQNVGFDLAAYDWVIPYGMGTHADFVFNLQRLPTVSRQNYDATLTVTFSNKGDGIQIVRENLQYGSQYKLPRYAPENGYESKLVLHEEYAPEGPVKMNFAFRAEDLNYVFRIRSTEKEGKIESAMYGKTRGYISFTAMESKTAKIYFTYYLNPDYTRNLEFDPKRNLFGNLPDLERVTEP